MADVEEKILEVVGGLPLDRRKEVLDFALFLQAQEQRQEEEATAWPVQRLEEFYGDFWPEDESVDDFIATVNRWRKEDIKLHRNLA